MHILRPPSFLTYTTTEAQPEKPVPSRRHPYLEITYRKGKPLAGYLYLKSAQRRTSCRTREICPGILLDVAPDGEPLGIEFLSPGRVTSEELEAIRRCIHDQDLPAEDLAPVMAR